MLNRPSRWSLRKKYSGIKKLLKNQHVTKGARGDALFFSYPALYFIHFSEHLSGSLTVDNSKNSAGGVHVSLLGTISES